LPSDSASWRESLLILKEELAMSNYRGDGLSIGARGLALQALAIASRKMEQLALRGHFVTKRIFLKKYFCAKAKKH